MPSLTKKAVAQMLREAGHTEAALDLMLTNIPGADDSDFEAKLAANFPGSAPAGGPSVAGPGPEAPLIEQLAALPEADLRKTRLTVEQARSLTAKEVASIRELPGGAELIAGTMAALKPAGA